MRKSSIPFKILVTVIKFTCIPFLVSLICTSLSFARSGLAQELLNREVSIQADQQELKSVLASIEKSAQVKFSYVPSLIKNQKVTFSATNQTLKVVLKELLVPLQIRFSVSGDYIILNKKKEDTPDAAKEQGLLVPLPYTDQTDMTIKGQVTASDSKEPLPGVSVVVKGTQQGAITSGDGSYSLVVPDESAVLVFSFVGYVSQEIQVANRSLIHVTLEADIKALSEVVVTGYTTQSRRDITGSVSVIDADKLLAVPATNLAQQLQGRAAGVTVGTDNTPGGGVAVRVRGYGTLGNNDPLYVIDGVPTKGSLNTINQNDIESIQILKDASSASIYGSRAANGVVIITTKRGKTGVPKFTFDAYYGVQRLARTMDLLNTAEYGQYLWQSKRNANVVNPATGNPEHAQFGRGAEPVTPDYIIPDGASADDPRVNPANYSFNRYNDPQFGKTKFSITKANKEGTDWQNEVFDPAPIQNYQLGVSGGSENSRYAFSTNYFNQQGILIYNGYKRYSVRANTEFTIRKRLRIGENLQVAYGQRQGNYGNNSETSQVSNTYRAQPIIPVYDIGGNFAGTLGSNLGNANNPVGQLIRNKNNGYKDLRIFGNAYAEVDILKNLTAKTSFGMDATVSAGTYFTPVEIELAHGTNVNSLSENRSYSYAWTWTNSLTYDKTFGSHHLNVFAGLESIDSYGNFVNAYRQGFFSNVEDLRYIDAGNPSTSTNSGYATSSWSLFSYFGRIDYAFQDKYLLQGTVRRDASSRFQAASRYATFPAASVGWRLSKEAFLANVGFITDLKLRAGWGQTGNQEIGDFNAYSTYQSNPNSSGYGIGGAPIGYVQGFDLARFGNPNAKWETTTTVNVGLDANLFKGKFDLSLDVYDRQTKDLLYTKAYDPRLGDAAIPAQNIASLQNRGIDLGLNYNDAVMDGQLTYSIGVNFSTYRNKILALDPQNPNDFLPGFSLRTPAVTRSIAGRPISSFYGYIIDGILQNEEQVAAHAKFPGYYDSNIYINGKKTQGVGKFNYRDINNDGIINANDQTYIGSPHPDFTYGINANVTFKNFDLTIFAQGVQGNEIFNHVRYWTDFEVFQGNRTKRMLYESWRPDNPDAKLPILDANDAQSGEPSTYFVENGSYLRFKNIQLGYTLPKSVLNKIGTDHLKVYVQAQNLFTFTKYTGLDPEVNLRNFNSGSDRQIGVDEGVYPTPKSIIVGLSLGF
ncbi:SusC/RagA family TonB-linked outer membrane protein [Dyadobacter sediminis]|uniref:TonB-dependent receptor n=1 Tax=Dyadobacter sediminis TaxID=1493691 RepID=A0A5R9KBL3_9BACT|nr:TonB-dependent receptor [Dyadobacter sediminis]TLU92164.1 TonB-dependent receptor [Dyadobacter sediminis]GGB96882.1 SusC/RagA family TonB-linked outer membrane protein [Dyadobacter sediminis]